MFCFINAVPSQKEPLLTRDFQQYLRRHHGNGPASRCEERESISPRHFILIRTALGVERLVAGVKLSGNLLQDSVASETGNADPEIIQSALSSFFRLSASTTYAFHMIQAYVLFALVVAHGLLYASWIAAYNHARMLTRSPLVFPALNPTYLYYEVWPGNTSSLGIWRASLIFTGLTTSLIMLAVFVTTFPVIRRKHFNVFYFTHLLMIVAVVVICLHASTMFYCTAPGLAMWMLDWGMRLYELSGKMDSTLVAVGKGWFCLTVP